MMCYLSRDEEEVERVVEEFSLFDPPEEEEERGFSSTSLIIRK